MPPVNQTPTPLAGNSSKTKLITVVLAVLFAISAIGNVVIYVSQKNKNNVDARVASATAAAKTQQAAADKATYDAAAKAPYKTFTGSATYGSITFNYPKTYSVYNDATSTNNPINAYFFPDVVPSPQAKIAYALRLELSSQAYADALNAYSGQISGGMVKALAYLPPKLKNVANVSTGTILTGSISTGNSGAKGTLVIIKVRDKTLKIYDESTSFDSDFNNIVLPSLTFKP